MTRSSVTAALLFTAFVSVAIKPSAADPPLSERALEIRSELSENLQRQPLQPSDLQQSKAKVSEAIGHLEAFLQTADAEVVSGWKEYLMWSDLHQQLQLERPDIELLREILLRYRRNLDGIDLQAFTSARTALIQMIHMAEMLENMTEQQQFDHCLNRLATGLAKYELDPTYTHAYQIGRELFCVEKSSAQPNEQLAAIRNRFRHPNAYGRASLRAVNQMLAQDINDETVINQSSDGRVTRGTATTQAHLKAEFVSAGDRATLNLHLAGTTRADRTVTEQGPVTVYGSFLTKVEARKRVFMTEKGLSYQPARANCSTSVQIHDIVANRRVVERIAWRRAPRMTPEAEADVSRTTERQIQTQLDEKAETALGEANHVFISGFCVPNKRYGTFPDMQFSTTSDHLQMQVRAAQPWHLAAPDAPPQFDENHDLAFAIHESMLGNYAEGVFGGKQITDTQWLRMLNVMTGSEPRSLWVHDRTDRWSMTFADKRPIMLRFADAKFHVAIRTKQFVRENQQLQRPIEIASTFRIQITDGAPVLIREGNVDVHFVDQQAVNKAEQEILDFIHWKFDAIMPEELHADGLVPPAGGSLGMLRKLLPKEFSFKSGWMTIGYQLLD